MKTPAKDFELSLHSAQMLGTSDLAFTRCKKRKHPPILKVSEPRIWRWVKRWVKKGIFLKPVQIGGKAFWSAKDIAELIQQRAA